MSIEVVGTELHQATEDLHVFMDVAQSRAVDTYPQLEELFYGGANVPRALGTVIKNFGEISESSDERIASRSIIYKRISNRVLEAVLTERIYDDDVITITEKQRMMSVKRGIVTQGIRLHTTNEDPMHNMALTHIGGMPRFMVGPYHARQALLDAVGITDRLVLPQSAEEQREVRHITKLASHLTSLLLDITEQ